MVSLFTCFQNRKDITRQNWLINSSKVVQIFLLTESQDDKEKSVEL